MDKLNITKNALFRALQTIIVLLLIRNSYTSWSTWFISLKLCIGFSIFDSVSFLLDFIFCSTKSMDSLTLKRHNSFQNKNTRKATHRFAPRTLIFKLLQKVLNSMMPAWYQSLPKADLKTNFLNLKNRTFQNISNFYANI